MQKKKYAYTGDRKAKALVVSENIKYDVLNKKFVEKITLDKRYKIEVKYVSPHTPNFPPFNLNDENFEVSKYKIFKRRSMTN